MYLFNHMIETTTLRVECYTYDKDTTFNLFKYIILNILSMNIGTHILVSFPIVFSMYHNLVNFREFEHCKGTKLYFSSVF